jgi:glutamine phosphoribosylpyrophosphate amidotransferase
MWAWLLFVTQMAFDRLWLGVKSQGEHKSYMVASESVALDVLGL